ncbi:MAG TPA: aminodeoxychorismate synthase component I [Streptosporangiaceae bacterium]
MSSRPAGRLVRRALDWDLTPVEALGLVRGDAHPVALIGAWAAGDVISSCPVAVRSPPQPLADVLDTPAEGEASDGQAPDGEVPDAFGGGWIGYLGYGLAGALHPAGPVPPAPGPPRRLPTWWFGFYDHVLRRDRASGRWTFEALWTPDRADALERRFDDLSGRPGATGPGDEAPAGYSCGDFRLVPPAAGHRAAVRQAIELIRQGDIFQANICLRLEADFGGDPLDAFAQAVTRLRSPYAAFLRLTGGAVASLSPELFLRRHGRTVLSRPIKGTSHRSSDAGQAARQRDELASSAKNRAENVMIVDLMRNDLSRVCVPGSVRVPRLVRPEAHPDLWHLVSDVRGTLTAQSGDGDLIRATFPPGSVTGAPKVRAMEVIHQLEPTAREIYTGALGYRSPVAGLELNVAIRTFEFHRGKVWLGCGGGIVADSDPGDEFRECLLKADPLVRALGGRISREAGPAASTPPRPAAGVFTSLLVSSGQVQDLAAHLERLEASVRRLFGKGLPAQCRADLAARLAGAPSGRLRITVRPRGGPLRAVVEVVPLEPPTGEVRLRPVVIPGGLGAHKWLDRQGVTDLARAGGLGAGEQLLIEDADGSVLETDRANIFALIDGVLHTPADDGRLLPGVTRAAVLRLAARDGIEVRLAPLTRARLAAASEVFVTNSVRGVLPVHSIAGSLGRAWPAGPVASRVAGLLRSRPADRHPVAAVQAVPASGQAPPANGLAPVRLLAAAAASPSPGPRRGQAARPVVVVIDNYDSFTYNLVPMLLRQGCAVEVVRNDEVPAEAVAAFGPAGVVISPGPCAPADAGISIAVVRACADQIPLLGVCLGHQAIAAAYGARIVKSPAPVHGQAAEIAHDGRGIFRGLPQPFPAARYHSLLVDERSLPPFLTVTARACGRLPMALRHAARPVEGVQFHPESILTAHGDLIIGNFTQAIRCRNAGDDPAAPSSP